MAVEAEFTTKEVAAHNQRQDCWMTIRGEVYDLTKYLDDHPGGVDILVDVAGKDGTQAFDDAGHSEDAEDIMAAYRIGKLKGGSQTPAVSKAVRLTVKAIAPANVANSSSSSMPAVVGGTVVSLGVLTGAVFGLRKADLSALSPLLSARSARLGNGTSTGGIGFVEGFFLASTLALLVGGWGARRFSQMISMDGFLQRHAPHKKIPRIARPDPLLVRGWLDPHTFHPLPLVKKELIAPNVYRLVFELPTPDTVLGLPIGQHVAIKATIDGATVQRSYTPVSNNADKGILDLVIKVYPDGQLTGKYLANLSVGDEVLFRGPKGAMRYKRGLCNKIGMLAGGTGITPMYQLIRAICEDPKDTTEVSLIYANRTEEDILLRQELESFARRYPMNLKIHYLLDSPPENWAYGTGFVTKDVMAQRFPEPSCVGGSKVLLCGPPGMVNAAKKALVELGFEKPGVASKMTDQVFCF
ncbi:hypothetical protein BD289DRAFT_482687 [Coniella lustricola]|uniref:Uncharacterized protein n=1 Tax=Coniella lustricola TaxID=2025994 RepID=A0A2T3A876_9PEZI|nr:hypothetical protein BD289DRAFT_482687 [Coniella lustricola]